MTDSNRRHSACKADALPTELITQKPFKLQGNLRFKPEKILVILLLRSRSVGVYYIDLIVCVKPFLQKKLNLFQKLW